MCERLVKAADAGDFLVRSDKKNHYLYVNDHNRLQMLTIKKRGEIPARCSF